MACCASAEEPTEPESSTEAPEERTSNLPFGMLCISRSRRVERFRSRATVTSRAAIWRPSASMMKIVVAPSAMPITNTLRVERTTALATAGLATNTSLASRGRSTITERPAVSSTRGWYWPRHAHGDDRSGADGSAILRAAQLRAGRAGHGGEGGEGQAPMRRGARREA